MRLISFFTALLFSALATAEVRVTDDLGNEIVLAKPAERVISLAPHITEVVFAVGAGEQLVGAVTYSDYPEAAKDVPLIGSYNEVYYEAIVQKQPDLIFAWNSGNGEQTIKRLRELGFTVYVGEPRKLDHVPKMLRDYGVLTGHAEQGEAAAETFIAKRQSLHQRYGSKQPMTIFYQAWNDPLITLNGKHLISDVIRLCGGKNVFADAIPIAPRVNMESVIAANPQVIVASGMGEARPEWLDDWRSWSVLQAVQNNHLYFIPPDILQRHTPRILDGAQLMCEHLESARTDSQ